MGTLWNAYYFYVLYADIDQFDPTQHDLRKAQLTLMDKWILSQPEHADRRRGRRSGQLSHSLKPPAS